MKKLWLLFMLLPCLSFAGGIEYPIYHYYDMPNRVTTYQTVTIPVKTLDYQGVTISVVDDTITLSSNTYTITIKKSIKAVAVPVEIEP